MASYMGNPNDPTDDGVAVAAQTVLRNIGMILFMIPVGIAIATNVLVGNNIGANRLDLAKYYAKMCFTAGLIWAILSVAVVAILQKQIVAIFTDDQ